MQLTCKFLSILQQGLPARLAYSKESPDFAVQILGKAEFLNPGGSVKDRVALRIVQEALASGQLQPGGLITEGTAGSTGVSLAMVGESPPCLW